MFAKAAESAGLTARQLVVLSIVADTNDPSQTLICEKSGIDRSTLADIVARLVSRGLLSRRRTKLDGRKYAVKLTEAGRKCLDQAIPAAQGVDLALTQSITSEQRAILDLCLSRFLSVDMAK
jgi:DNA-binding MarR family transcriptional regulator